jgi:hypothetical protein
MWREEIVQVEVRKPAVGYKRGKEFPQAARFDSAQRANLFEDYAPQRIVKNTGIEQSANLQACAWLQQHRAKEAQRVALQLQTAV